MATAYDCCPSVPTICDKTDKLLSQFKHSPKLCGIITSVLEEMDIINCALLKTCNKDFDCEGKSGEELDAIGSLVGLSRCNCNAICDPCSPLGVSDYCFTDEEYCRFIKTKQVTNSSDCSVGSMQEAVIALWGPDAVVVNSGNGSVGVWPGRELSATEKLQYALYKKVLPLCLGVSLVIYDTDQPIPSWCCPTDVWCEAVPACILQDCTRLKPTNTEPLTLCLDFCECESTIAADLSCDENPPQLTFTLCDCDSVIDADGP